jgi:Putative phage holin Dp-1
MKFKNEVYDVLKFIAQILLPGLATAYFGIAGVWNLPASSQVIGTISILDTFLGVLLGLSSKAYIPPLISPKQTDGRLLIDKTDPTKDVYRVELTKSLDKIDAGDHFVLETQIKTLDATQNGASA